MRARGMKMSNINTKKAKKILANEALNITIKQPKKPKPPTSIELILQGLINCADDISAEPKYNSTRIPNQIGELKNNYGIVFDNVNIRTPSGKWYRRYYLAKDEANFEKARTLLEQMRKARLVSTD